MKQREPYDITQDENTISVSPDERIDNVINHLCNLVVARRMPGRQQQIRDGLCHLAGMWRQYQMGDLPPLVNGHEVPLKGETNHEVCNN